MCEIGPLAFISKFKKKPITVRPTKPIKRRKKKKKERKRRKKLHRSEQLSGHWITKTIRAVAYHGGLFPERNKFI